MNKRIKKNEKKQLRCFSRRYLSIALFVVAMELECSWRWPFSKSIKTTGTINASAKTLNSVTNVAKIAGLGQPEARSIS